MAEPFIIYALPRSRTAWLAHFLSYRDWRCGHEQAMYMRSIADIKALFALECVGTVETAAAQGWRIIHAHCPSMRQVVIRRPVNQVVDAMMKIDLKGVAIYDRERLTKGIAYGDRMLEQVARQPGVLSFNYDDLELESVCKKIFEFCLPYRFDKGWWEKCRHQHIEVNVAEVVAYYYEHFEEINSFKRECWRELRRLAREGEIPLKRAA